MSPRPDGPGLPFTIPAANNAIDVFGAPPAGNTPSVSGSAPLRPASREVPGCARSGNADPCPDQTGQNPEQSQTLEWTGRFDRHPDTIFSSRFSKEQLRADAPSKLLFPQDTRPHLPPQRIGGAERDRTADPLLAKQVLSQLSYSPVPSPITPGDPAIEPCPPARADARAHQIGGLAGNLVGPGKFELPTSPLSGVRSNQLSYGPGSQVS